MASSISDQTSPDSINHRDKAVNARIIRAGGWLFRRRTVIPVPIAAAVLLIPARAARLPWVVIAGVVVTLAGEALRLSAVHRIGVISRTRSERLGPLVDTGPFAVVRNPLYVGNIALWAGFALTAQLTWLVPLIAVLLAAEYHAIVRWEERLLETRMGEAYREYRARVPRWIPRLTSRGAGELMHHGGHGGHGEKKVQNPSSVSPVSSVVDSSQASKRFTWRDTLFSERGTLIAIAAAWMLLWLKARF
jgi:protein-S-isoprenylcysteine O-methyltransferase Ste14